MEISELEFQRPVISVISLLKDRFGVVAAISTDIQLR